MQKIVEALILEFQEISQFRLHLLEGTFDPFRESSSELIIRHGCAMSEIPIHRRSEVLPSMLKMAGKVIKEDGLSEHGRTDNGHVIGRWLV